MANANVVRGLVPYSNGAGSAWNGKATLCYIPSTDATAVFVGDLVKSAGSADANGVSTVTQSAAGNTHRGVVVGFLPDPTNLTLNYRTASTNRYVYVCDDPDVVFETQEDAVGGALAAVDVGLNAEVVVGSGNTVTGKSGMQLDTSTKATTNTLSLRILGFSQRVDNAIGANAKVLVKINLHELRSTTGVA